MIRITVYVFINVAGIIDEEASEDHMAIIKKDILNFLFYDQN